ncbi:MAG: hypothetical protein L0H84_04295, partial [Pseudonocardia sp.]|nr:hypothetical protein [Pseudonocardia sp.]
MAVAAGVAVGVLGLGGCGGGQETAGPERGVTIDAIEQPQYFYEGEYLGEQVTVSATVTNVLGPRSFELAGGAYGDDSLLVQTSTPVDVALGQDVRVTGTVGQFHRLAENDYAPGTYDRYEKYETEP